MTTRLGKYALTTANTASWLDQNIKSKKSNRKQKKEKDYSRIFYQSLLDGADYIIDNEWKDIIIDTAYGYFPTGFSNRADGITYTLGAKKVSISPSEDPDEAISQIINFFKRWGGIKTRLDIENEKTQYINNIQDSDKSWSGSKKIQQKVIINFSSRLCGGDEKKIKQLCTTINIGLTSGVIANSDIVFNQGRILEIKNSLLYNERTGKYYLSSIPKNKIKRHIPKECVPDEQYFKYHGSFVSCKPFKGFSQAWEKYLKNLNSSSSTKMTERPSPYIYSNRGPVTPLTSKANDDCDYSSQPDYLLADVEHKVPGYEALLSPHPELVDDLLTPSKLNEIDSHHRGLTEQIPGGIILKFSVQAK